MRRAAVLASLVVLSVAAVAAAAATPGFRYGVAAGEVTATSALLWTRAPAAGSVGLELDGEGTTPELRLRASRARDLTLEARVTGLQPATHYAYRFRQAGRVSATGRFTTAPDESTNARVRFAITGDADATPAADGKPAYSFGVYARIAAERNDFNINLGDTIYSDSGIGGAPFARTVGEKRAKYRLALAHRELRALRRSAGLYSHWGDHEFVDDFSRPEHGDALYRAGVAAFRDYSPVSYSAVRGLYRTRRWGKHLELFFLDTRSFRSAKSISTCAGHFAPTLPQGIRDHLASLAPFLRDPVPGGCLGSLADRSRTLLGTQQLEAFERAIGGSKATWKVVLTDVPIQRYYLRPYDRWEGYAAERAQLLSFLQASVRNVVFLTTDTHSNLVSRVRGPIWEVSTGPAATDTMADGLDLALGRSGGGAALASRFFKPSPPRGLGLRCAALDVPSYAQVTVTARTLAVAPRDARGRPVREATGRPCRPLVLRAR